MTELEPAVLRAYIETHAAVPDPEAVAKAEARLSKAAAALAGALDGHDYLVDDRFTIADVVMGGVLHSARRLKLMPNSPVLLAYLTRLDGREAKQRAYAA